MVTMMTGVQFVASCLGLGLGDYIHLRSASAVLPPGQSDRGTTVEVSEGLAQEAGHEAEGPTDEAGASVRG